MRLLTSFILFYVLSYNLTSSFNLKKNLFKFRRKKVDELKKCRVTHNGAEYEGDIAETKTRLLCQQWDATQPVHKVAEEIVDSDFPDGNKKKARNYCRNPQRLKPTPWCYTMDINVEQEECGVPLCVKKECRLTGPGVEYAGLTHYSGSRECHHWIDISGVEYKHVMFDSLFPDKTRKEAENRCRNPDSDPGGPWCYVDTGVRAVGVSAYEKAHCGIPFCDPKPCMTTTTLVSSGYSHYHTVFSRLPPNTTWIDFSVKLWNPGEWRNAELVIALSVLPIPLTGELMKMWKNGIEILISTYKSGIVPREGEKPDWNIETELLRGTRWQDLELSWTGGFISLKIKGKAMSVFSKDYIGSQKDMFTGDFQYFSIKGSHALWNFPYCSSEFCDERIVTTHGDFDRRWPLPKTSTGYELKFFVRGLHTAIIELKMGAMLQYPSVQLTLVNRKKENRTTLTIGEAYGKERKFLSEVKIEPLLSNWEWREFQLVIDKTRLKLFWIKQSRAGEVLDVVHPKFELLKWFSIGSRQSTVYWTLNCSPRVEELKIQAELPECVMAEGEKEFKGYQSTTVTGLTCLPWSDTTGKGFVVKYRDDKFIDGSAEDAKNYCRNPSGSSKGPFCFAGDLTDSGYQVKNEFCFPRICRSKECKMAGTGNDYIGSLNTTISLRICQRWTAKSPHEIPQSLLYDEMFPELSLNDANNMCRNPSHDPAGLWCYTSDPAVVTDLCHIPDCDTLAACTIIVKGNITRQSIYILPLWRTLGFTFKVKSWDPKKTEGIRFIIRSASEVHQLRLDMGGVSNDKIILYHNTTDGKEIIVKQKTVGHIIPSGQWAGFVLVLGFGEVSVYYENVPSPFFVWKYIYSENIEPFLPRYLSYYSLGNIYSIGLNTACDECHTHITEPGLSENIYPLNWWKPEIDQRNSKKLILFFRGTGTFIIVLHRLINDVSDRVLIEVSNNGLIVVKDKDSVLGEIRKEEPLFKNNTWTNFTLEFSEEILYLSLENTIIFKLNSSKILLFYYFSISVSTGLLKWSANCEPPNIDAGPVNGGWSEWGQWDCSVTCGGGHGKRKRKCDRPKPNLFGQPCNGSDVMEGVCNDFRCGDVPPLLYKTIASLMTKQSYNIQKHVGENLIISCNPYILTELKDVSPKTKVGWTKDGVLVKKQERVGNISVDKFHIEKISVNMSDSGIYICGLEDRKGLRTAIQLTSVTVTTNSTTTWTREGGKVLLGCEVAPLTFIYSDLIQFWTVNGRLYQDPKAHWHSFSDIDWLYPVKREHQGEWECVVHQIKHNLTWITTWFRLGVLKSTILGYMFDRGIVTDSFRPFGNYRVLNSIVWLFLIGVFTILCPAMVFCYSNMGRALLKREKRKMQSKAPRVNALAGPDGSGTEAKESIYSKIKKALSKLNIYKPLATGEIDEEEKKEEIIFFQNDMEIGDENSLLRQPSTPENVNKNGFSKMKNVARNVKVQKSMIAYLERGKQKKRDIEQQQPLLSEPSTSDNLERTENTLRKSITQSRTEKLLEQQPPSKHDSPKRKRFSKAERYQKTTADLNKEFVKKSKARQLNKEGKVISLVQQFEAHELKKPVPTKIKKISHLKSLRK